MTNCLPFVSVNYSECPAYTIYSHHIKNVVKSSFFVCHVSGRVHSIIICTVKIVNIYVNVIFLMKNEILIRFAPFFSYRGFRVIPMNPSSGIGIVQLDKSGTLE